MAETTVDMAALLKRIQKLEDIQEITQLLATHPLAVDGAMNEEWLTNWTEDSLVDRPGDPARHSGAFEGIYGKDVLAQELVSPELEAHRKNGLCHFTTAPRVIVTGDTAAATNYLQLYNLGATGYQMMFVIVSHWDLRREKGRWMITKRTIRAVGFPEAQDMVRKTFLKA